MAAVIGDGPGVASGLLLPALNRIEQPSALAGASQSPIRDDEHDCDTS